MVHADLRAGQHVLVQGGAGGVGIYVVQIAAGLGAREDCPECGETAAVWDETGSVSTTREY